MNVSPVSFKSLLCFTINDKKPKGELPTLIKTAFSYNRDLKGYKLVEKPLYEETIDGTVHNAHANLCEDLDKKYAQLLPKGSKQVFLTPVNVYVNPTKTEKRYYLTAATNDDEQKILYSSFANSRDFFVAKFRDKSI